MADNFKFVQGINYKLAGSGCIATASEIILSSFTLPDGTLITMSMFGDTGYMTLEPGTSKEENISFTGVTQNANGTATLTGVTKGLNFVAPYTSEALLKLAHAGGTIAIISNSAPFYNELSAKDNDETITSQWTFTDPKIPKMDTYSAPTDDEQLATKKYVDDIASGGTASINRIVVAGIAGETVTAGKVVYFDTTDKEWKLADGSSVATCDNVLLGIAQGAGTNGNPISGGVLLEGFDSNQTGFTAGDTLYISDTAGTIASSAGTISKKVGYAKSATEIYFKVDTNDLLRADGAITRTADGVGVNLETSNPGLKITTNKLDVKLKTAGGILSGSDGLYTSTTFQYGDGSDGDITINSGTFSSGPITSNCLTRDAYFNNLTINSGYQLDPKGFQIYVKGTVNTIGTGKIVSNGVNGAAGSSSSGGSGGALPYTSGTLPLAIAGGAGGNGASGSGAQAGVAGGNCARTLAPISITGATGGGGGGNAAGGAGGSITSNCNSLPYSLTSFGRFFEMVAGIFAAHQLMPGAGGGGGCNGTGGYVGGGGGQGGTSGGFIFVSAFTVTNLNIEAIGGNGGAGGSTSGGTGSQGGAGNGGIALVVYNTKGTITYTLTKGTGGTGGSNGFSKEVQI